VLKELAIQHRHILSCKVVDLVDLVHLIFVKCPSTMPSFSATFNKTISTFFLLSKYSCYNVSIPYLLYFRLALSKKIGKSAHFLRHRLVQYTCPHSFSLNASNLRGREHIVRIPSASMHQTSGVEKQCSRSSSLNASNLRGEEHNARIPKISMHQTTDVEQVAFRGGIHSCPYCQAVVGATQALFPHLISLDATHSMC